MEVGRERRRETPPPRGGLLSVLYYRIDQQRASLLSEAPAITALR